MYRMCLSPSWFGGVFFLRTLTSIGILDFSASEREISFMSVSLKTPNGPVPSAHSSKDHCNLFRTLSFTKTTCDPKMFSPGTDVIHTRQSFSVAQDRISA